MSDPNRRYIYDRYGAEGIQSVWDLSAPLDKKEFLWEYERRAELKKDLEEQQRAQSKGELKLSIDATRWLTSLRSEGLKVLLDPDERPEIDHALVVHSWEVVSLD